MKCSSRLLKKKFFIDDFFSGTLLEEVGVPLQFYTVKGAGHGQFKDPKVAELTRALFQKYLKPASR